jgi:membrane fusion protein (multidrug efflux system)
MTRKLLAGILIVLVVFGVLATVKFFQVKAMIAAGAHYVPPPETISSAVAHQEAWPDTLPAVGSVSAAQGVTIAPEIAGTVSEIDFESGATVNQGDLLVRLDASSEEAQLRASEAQADLAKITAERQRKLVVDKTISQSELDQAEAAYKQAAANADNIRAVIEKKTIRAPFAGRLGIRLINLGEQLDVGKSIVSLQSPAPMFVDFSLPQANLSQLANGLKVGIKTDAYPGVEFEGEIAAINPDLDVASRSVRVRAKYDNADGRLRGGMFVQAEVLLPDAKPVLAIPATALLSAPSGDSVFLVLASTNSSSTNPVVQQAFIRTGRTRGDFVSVESGLKAGDKVATAGIFKLRSGMAVTENNEIAPPISETPTPPNH